MLKRRAIKCSGSFCYKDTIEPSFCFLSILPFKSKITTSFLIVETTKSWLFSVTVSFVLFNKFGITAAPTAARYTDDRHYDQEFNEGEAFVGLIHVHPNK